MERKNISSGAVWEPIVGYSRAVRIGSVVEVSGTTAMRDGQLLGVRDIKLQTQVCLENINRALVEAGVTLEDVVRTRIYITDIAQWQAAGEVHGQFFGTIRPATTMIEVSKLIHPDMLIEIEATAILA
jgi:enamine deaminase RidA (YjgF/YER057c/UK114 family)